MRMGRGRMAARRGLPSGNTNPATQQRDQLVQRAGKGSTKALLHLASEMKTVHQAHMRHRMRGQMQQQNMQLQMQAAQQKMMPPQAKGPGGKPGGGKPAAKPAAKPGAKK